MVEAMTATLRRWLWLLALFAVSSAAFAHRLDELLQATLVDIEPGGFRLQINLTPGVAVAGQLIALIDRNHDGVISTKEAAAYAELLKRDLTVRLDLRNVELKLTASNFPEPAELRTGSEIIQMEFSGTTGRLAAGSHTLSLENRHLPEVSVYLVNAARPGSASIQIASQKRNDLQSRGEIGFDFNPPPNPGIPIAILVSLAALFVLPFAAVWRAKRKQNVDLSK